MNKRNRKKRKTPEYTDTLSHKVKVWAGRTAARIVVFKSKKEGNEIMSNLATQPKQALQGKLTYVSLAVGALSLVFQLLGQTFPQEEANAIVNWANSNWPEIVQITSLITAFYGRLRREWRAKKEAEAIKQTATQSES